MNNSLIDVLLSIPFFYLFHAAPFNNLVAKVRFRRHGALFHYHRRQLTVACGSPGGSAQQKSAAEAGFRGTGGVVAFLPAFFIIIFYKYL